MGVEILILLSFVVVSSEGRRFLTKNGKPRKDENEIEIRFVNPYNEPREIVWLNPNGEQVHMGMLSERYGETTVNTYVGHAFGWKIPFSTRSNTCEKEGDNECHLNALEGKIQILPRMKSPYYLGNDVETGPAPKHESNEPFMARFVNKSSKRTMRLVRENGTQVKELAPGEDISEVSVHRGEGLDWLEGDEILYRSVVEFFGQDIHSFLDETYTALCSDATSASDSIRNFTYFDAIENRNVYIQVLNEVPLIVLARNWSSSDQCQGLENLALQTGLSAAQVFAQRAIVADRRALSANLYWNESYPNALTNTLIRRAFDFTKQLRGYNIVPGPFQEPLNYIQYSYAQEYRPHCDGVSVRKPYARGGRVATLLHYCQAATRGGATVFPKLNLKVQPSPNDAVLFTYKQDDNYMDDGNTLHTGCLVRNGTKSVVTMWMRESISSEEPWSDFLS